MNTDHLHQIFSNYIKRFAELNDKEHGEYYKWRIADRFRNEMDQALDSSDGEFSGKLYELRKLTENFIDSYTQPFYGLVKFAEREPKTVKEMFRELFSDDGGDLALRQKKVQSFIKKSHELRDEYYPDSFLYSDDMHSVTGYLFLYDPDRNYIFKASHALNFADCVEFYDDWGTGENVSLEIYYRMCDQVVEEIKRCKELLEINSRRYEISILDREDPFYTDPENHILAFDIIYCSSAYGLFDGITFKKPSSKERLIIKDRKERAKELFDALEKAREKDQILQTAKEYVNSIYKAGATVLHEKYGTGTVKQNNGSNITVYFPDAGEKNFGTIAAAEKGIIKTEADGYGEKIAEYREYLKNDQSIRRRLTSAEKEFAPYAEYYE